jgi:hypothetical protein
LLPRTHWQRHIATLDPERDYEEIYRILLTHEFPWDFVQSLSLALFRTYAVPSIARLLDQTGELTGNTQKRYDDTTLLLEEASARGLHSPHGRRAVRRINQMHAAYDIDPDDMRYVLSTFVVTPTRWLERFGWRPLSPGEVRASTLYYRELGRLMSIKNLPETYDNFSELLDSYEEEHFAFDPAGRRVADATTALLLTFYPRMLGGLVRLFTHALMDQPLLAAFGYRQPPTVAVRAATAALKARASVEALLPARARPLRVRDMPRIRSYPAGYDVGELGTFPRGCAVVP